MGTLMKNTDQRQLTSDYAPYEAFWEGFVDYRHGLHRNPYDAVPTQDVECQAWDRGQEAGMRATRAIGSV
jgi:hypothetical protein